MALPSGLIALPKFDNTVGAALIGNTVAAALFGVTTVQVYIYFQRSSQDKAMLKWLVSFLWLLDATEQALFTSAVYYYAVTNFVNPLTLLIASPSVGPTTIVSGVSDIVCRAIFSYRLWKFGGRWYLLVLIAVLSIMALAGSATIVGLLHKVNTFSAFSAQYGWVLYATFSCGAAADIVIAAALTLSLWQHRTASPRTNSLIRTLMIYTINTGALTSIFAIVSLITFATMPNNFIFIAFFFVLPKLLLNSILATLNARSSIRRAHLERHDHVSIHLSNLAGTPPIGGRQEFGSIDSGGTQGAKRHVQKNTIQDLASERV